jgi:hypothetical protein
MLVDGGLRGWVVTVGDVDGLVVMVAVGMVWARERVSMVATVAASVSFAIVCESVSLVNYADEVSEQDNLTE